MVTAGSQLHSLSQISRALKQGFAVEASLVEMTCLGPRSDILLEVDVINQMTDLSQSAYCALTLSIDPDEYRDLYFTYWKFEAVKR